MRIVIVGSMKFYNKYQEIKEKLEKKGNQAIIPLTDEFYTGEDSIKRKSMEDFNKALEDSDAILVANFDKDGKKGYIGTNSLMEIGMAFNRHKKVFLLKGAPEEYSEELKAIGIVVLHGNLDKIRA